MPSLTARENVALITEIARDPMTPEEALARVGLSDRLDHFPAQLSGGEQQRVAVARAIAKRPELLFCDEPTGSLDSESGVQVLEAIAEVARRVGATTMIVSHNTGIARDGRPGDPLPRRTHHRHRRQRAQDRAAGDELVRPRALDRKLLRDLWRMRWQVLAIALLIACGVSVAVMAFSAQRALEQAQADFYRRDPLRRRVRQPPSAPRCRASAIWRPSTA